VLTIAIVDHGQSGECSIYVSQWHRNGRYPTLLGRWMAPTPLGVTPRGAAMYAAQQVLQHFGEQLQREASEEPADLTPPS